MKGLAAMGSAILLVLPLSLASRPDNIARATAAPSQQAQPDVHFDLGGNAAEIPAQFIDNRIFLPVRINNGKPSLFELDSSWSETSVDPARAAALGLPMESEPQKSPPLAAIIRECVLETPGLSMPESALKVEARAGVASDVGRVYEGTLGQDFFSRVTIEIDYERETVRLYDPQTYRYSGQAKPLHVNFAAGMPVIQAKVALAKGGKEEGALAVDTGLNASVLISDRSAEAHRLFSSHGRAEQEANTVWDAGKIVSLARLKDFSFGPYVVENSIAEFSDASRSSNGPKIIGEIGGGMLRHFRVIFDYPHQQMIFEPNLHFADEEQEDKSGISLIARGSDLKTFEIVHIQAKTPATDAGLREGDIISGIDEDAAADLDLAGIRNLFRQVGHQYKLLIDRNGQTMQVTIQMRRLL